MMLLPTVWDLRLPDFAFGWISPSSRLRDTPLCGRWTNWCDNSTVLHDLRQAFRAMRKNPGFTLTAVVTLALAIGANSAIFSLANALIFASMPVTRPDRLVEVSSLNTKGEKGFLSIPALQEIERSGVFESALGWLGGGMSNLEMNGALFAGSLDEVAGDYYSTLGIQPAVGRLLKRDDTGPVAVLGYRAWRKYFHGDRGAMGQTIRINGKLYTVVGVHPKSFPGLIREAAADATVPVASQSSDRPYKRADAYYTVIGRLRDGDGIGQVRARLEALWPAIRESTGPERIQVQSAAQGISYMRARFTQPLYVLFGIVGLLLLLACVNLASVALARVHSRAAEFGIRTALGATRWRLARAALSESLLVAFLGAIPGLLFAWWGSDHMAHFMWRGYVPLAMTLTPDWRVAGFTAAAAIAAGVLFGLIPAWRGTKLQAGARITGGLGRAGKALVAVQIALSFAILAGALVLGRSLINLLRADPGFRADRLLVAQLFPRSTYKGFDNTAYFRQLLASLRSMPGVTAASISHDRPIGQFVLVQRIEPAGVSAKYHQVAPGFFDTLGIRMVRGRDFDLHDDADHPLAAIVSAGLARKLAPSGDVLGARVRIGKRPGEFQIVGIAADATLDDPRTPDAPVIYAAWFQGSDELGWSDAIVRTPGDPAALSHALRERIEALGREYPLRIETVDTELDQTLLPERVLALLTGFFSALGLLLAAVGLYGLLSYTVSRRTGEIGVRVALGASRTAIAALILRDVAILLAIGLAAGLALAWTGARTIATFLHGLSSHDPVALCGSAALLVLVAVCAGLLPSIRAARVDPMTALRHE